MDRAHRLGQTKQVTVYRLICKGTIEERILQRAREKSEIQRMVISGGNFKPDTLKPKEVVSLLLDDEEIKMKYCQNTDNESTIHATDRNNSPTLSVLQTNDRKRRQQQKLKQEKNVTIAAEALPIEDDGPSVKSIKQDSDDDESIDIAVTSAPSSPSAGGGGVPGHNVYETYVPGATSVQQIDDLDNETIFVDGESPMQHGTDSPNSFLHDFNGMGSTRRRHHPRGTKRGRPRGSGRRGGGNGSTLQRSNTIDDSMTSLNSTIPGTPGNDMSVEGGDATPSTSAAAAAAALGSSANSICHSPAATSALPSSGRRGPGRPRLKTVGPTSRGTRGAPRARRPMGPLLVPIGRSPVATPLTRSPVLSPVTNSSEKTTGFISNNISEQKV